MRDVALAAGVSLKSVSRVVNEEGGVTPGLEQRVRKAIKALRYQPDDRARYLRRTVPGSRSIGFVQTDVANPFFSSIFRGLENVARANGFLVLAGSSDADPVREEALIRAFIARRVDGLVIASCQSDLSSLAAELDHGTPVVFVDLKPSLDVGDVVRTDHYGGAAIATKHLLSFGHRRVAFIGDDPIFFSASERRRAFLDVMTDAGLETPWVLSAAADPQAAEEAVIGLLTGDDRPTALFTAQNLVTLGAVKALHRLGLQQEIAMVGFDDVEVAELVEPKITVVPQNPMLLGQLAAARLFARLDGDVSTPEQDILPADLIRRGSGEIRPGLNHSVD